MSTQINFRITPSQKALVERILNNISNERKINKSDSFVYIIEKYENSLIDNVSSDYIAPNVRDVLSQIRCGYMGFANGSFICGEIMALKKEPKTLIGEPETVLKNCLWCIKWKREKAQLDMNKLLQKESIRKLQKFMKEFITISKSGFKYTAYICLCDADKGNMIFSRGGESLQCPLIEYELVNIQLTCMEKINPNTQIKPCEYLASLEGIQALDPTIFKDMSDVFSDETLLPLRANELEDIKQQNERLGINAEYEVIEEDENYEGECPKENNENESCIMPLCEHATKCDSYCPKKKWDKIPLK